MRIYLEVVSRSSQNKIEKIAAVEYKVWVSAVPEKGEANKAVIKFLAKHFGVSKSQVEIVSGKTARVKIVDILMN